MFNLEDEIKKWLYKFRKHKALNHGAMREMELHLRDHIDDLRNAGYTEEHALAPMLRA